MHCKSLWIKASAKSEREKITPGRRRGIVVEGRGVFEKR